MGFGKQQSSQEAQSQQASRQFVDPSQVPFLNFLRGTGSQLASQQLGTIGGTAEQLAGRLGGVGGDLLGQIQGLSRSFAPGAATAISSLLGITQGQDATALRDLATGPLAGQAELQRIAGGDFGPMGDLTSPGAAADQQIAALDTAIQRNLASTLGTIGGQATLQGQTGGDRQAFFSSEAAGRAQEAFAGEAAELLTADLAQRRALAGQQLAVQTGAAEALQQGGIAQGGLISELLRTGLAGSQAGGSLGLQQQGLQLDAAGGGISQLGDLFNLGMAPFSAQFSPLLALSQIVGAPTVLGESSGESTSRGSGSGFSFSNPFDLIQLV